MDMDDWHEMSSATVVNVNVTGSPAVAHTIKSPRDVAGGQATGKRQHKPFLLSSLTVDGINPTASDIEIYSFSWGMSNSGSSKTIESPAKATYDVKSNTKARTMAPSSGGCCSNGVCSVTVSVDKKHTKTGHVTLLK